MDNQEAIARIEDHMRVHHMGVPPHIKIAEALDMAIAALRQTQEQKSLLEERIRKDARYKEQYMTNPVFHTAVDAMRFGNTDPMDVILILSISVTDAQQMAAESMVRSGVMKGYISFQKRS